MSKRKRKASLQNKRHIVMEVVSLKLIPLLSKDDDDDDRSVWKWMRIWFQKA